MNTFWLASYLMLWVVVLFLGFLLLGTLRALGRTTWRLEQLEATIPSHVGRTGLRIGKKAPDFTLPSTAGGEAALHDFAGRKVLLVFVQPGCSPCEAIVPELNRLQHAGDLQVLAVYNRDLDAARRWAGKVEASFPVLVQQSWDVSRRYQVFATPFAFVLNEKGVITSKGIVNHSRHIGFVLSGTRTSAGPAPVQAELPGTEAEAF